MIPDYKPETLNSWAMREHSAPHRVSVFPHPVSFMHQQNTQKLLHCPLIILLEWIAKASWDPDQVSVVLFFSSQAMFSWQEAA